MAEQVKVSAAEPGDRSSSSETHMVERENWFLLDVL